MYVPLLLPLVLRFSLISIMSFTINSQLSVFAVTPETLSMLYLEYVFLTCLN